MIYNKISGTVVNPTTSLIFNQFEDEQCFLALARAGETWGMCALVNITLPTSISTLLGGSTGFVDKQCVGYDLGKSSVKIYKTAGNVADFPTDMTLYSSIPDQDLFDTPIYLEYINSAWCVLKNLPANYSDFMNASSGEKFYIVASQDGTYPDSPASNASIAKIDVKSVVNSSVLNEPVTLMLSSTVSGSGRTVTQYLPYASITRSATMLGEITYTGLTSAMFDGTEVDGVVSGGVDPNVDIRYANTTVVPTDESATGTYFYFVNSHNVQISDNLYLQPSVNADGTRSMFFYDGNGSKYLLFKAQRDSSSSPYYIKLSYAVAPNDLAVYHETLPFLYPTIISKNNVSDGNPPGFDTTFLNNPQVNSSLFDVQGYVRLRKTPAPNSITDSKVYTKISYVKEMTSTDEKHSYMNMGFTTDPSSPTRIETITMNVSEAVSRFGNIRPKPNGAPYTTLDTRLYLWSTEFIVGDVVTITSNDVTFPPMSITGVNYDEGYIVFGTNRAIGGSTPVVPADDNSNLSPTSQVVSVANPVVNRIDYAVCDDMNTALKMGMDSVMVDVQLPPTGWGLYDGVYRQLAVCHRPKYVDLTSGTPVLANCTDANTDIFSENGSMSLYYDGPMSSNHSWEAGSILYLANKNPVYRKYIKSNEIFKLII